MFSRLFLFLLAGIPALCGSATTSEEPGAIQDLYYGEALYQLYQEKYFNAIVHLLSARQQGRMQAHGDEADLLLGGLYLAYGMPDQAETIFQQVLKQTASPQVHNRAWLQLAKSRHRLNQLQAANNAIAEIGTDLSEPNREELNALQGLIALEQDKSAQALEILRKPRSKNDWYAYNLYNQSMALLRLNQTEEGLKVLQKLGKKKVDSPEMKALRDRANLIRGYLLLQLKRPAEAQKALQQIRLSSLATNQALLGVGWAALQQDDPQAALAPWQELASRDARDPAVLEALLAIPYALSLLEADAQSLQQYRLGIDRFDQEHARVEEAIEAIHQGRLIISLQNHLTLKQHNRPVEDEYGLLTLLPVLLTENNFQERLQDYRDLLSLQANLQQWIEKIDSYRTMLVVREAAYQEKLPKVKTKLSGDDLSRLESERDRLQGLIDQARSPEEPTFALANAEEKDLLARFDKIDELTEQIGEQGDMRYQRAQAELLRGILVWRMVTEHPARSWEIEKKSRELEQALEQTRLQQAALKQAHQDTRGSFKDFENQIRTLEGRIPGLLAEVKQAKAAQAGLLEQMAVEVLEERKSMINNYLIQARFGVASLLDRNRQGTGAAE